MYFSTTAPAEIYKTFQKGLTCKLFIEYKIQNKHFQKCEFIPF